MFRRDSSPAARAEGLGRIRSSRRTFRGVGGVRSGRRRLVGDGQSAAAKMLVDGDAPAVKGRKGVADELHWSKAE